MRFYLDRYVDININNNNFKQNNKQQTFVKELQTKNCHGANKKTNKKHTHTNKQTYKQTNKHTNIQTN